MRSHLDAQLLLAVVRGDWDLTASLAPQVPAQRFVDRCLACDVHPWVDAALRARPDAAGLAPAALAGLGTLRAKVRADNMLLAARAEQALDLLLATGVRPIALKGVDFLHRFYRFDERTSDDVDLLVRRQDLAAALRALEAAGWEAPAEPRRTHYIRSSHHLPLVAPGPVPVNFELHWNLAQAGRYGVDVDGLFRRARPLAISGRDVLRLDDVDAATHLLLHHFSHYFDPRLKWLVDFGHLAAAEGFDWAGVVARCREWRIATAAGISLVHLRKLHPRLFPAGLLRQLPVARWRRLLSAPLLSNHPLELYRGSGKRRVQLYLAAVMLERPAELPGWLLHRRRRDVSTGDNPLDARHDES